MKDISLDQVASKRVRRFDAYWKSKLTDRGIPTREEIDPFDLPGLLPFLIIAEIEPSPFRVRYRLCGTMIQEMDEELTGRYLDELKNTSDEHKIGLTALFQRVFSSAQPQYIVADFKSRDTGFPWLIYGGVWPLRNSSGQVEQCVIIQDYVEL